ncbi:MAG: SprB repeat-containing protein, partial [Saprospiraceae bacterium]
MQLSNKFLVIPTVICSFFIFLAHSGNPEDRNTGAPFDGLCSNCHGGGNFDGDISVTGFPTTILPNTVYNLTFTVTATMGNPTVGGFQLVAVNASNVNSGDLAPANSETGTTFSGAREYIDHRGAKPYTGNSVSWNFSWTSPNGPNGSVITIYYSSNLANGNGSSSGDNIIFASKSGTMMGGGNPLSVSITGKKNISCFGGMDGSATATAAGGSTPYSYAWSNGETSNQLSNVGFGSYRITVTDNVGATASTSVALTQPSQLNHVVQITRNVSCPGGRDGAVTTSVSGGVQPYTVIYSSGSPNGLRAGQYTVTVMDNNTCSSSSTFTITEPDTFTVATPVFLNPTCPLDSNGAIKILVSGGNPPYKYKWNTNDTGTNLTKLKTGNYKLTITDSKNCNTLKSYELKSIDSIAPQLLTKDGTIYLNQEQGIAIPSSSNFIEILTDNCDPNPNAILSIDTLRCNQLGKSAYIMQAMDQSGNISKDTFFITVTDTFK